MAAILFAVFVIWAEKELGLISALRKWLHGKVTKD